MTYVTPDFIKKDLCLLTFSMKSNFNYNKNYDFEPQIRLELRTIEPQVRVYWFFFFKSVQCMVIQQKPSNKTPSIKATRQLRQNKNRSVSFLISVIKTPLLRPHIKAIRQLRPLLLIPIEEKSLYYGPKYKFQRKKTSFSDKVFRFLS